MVDRSGGVLPPIEFGERDVDESIVRIVELDGVRGFACGMRSCVFGFGLCGRR